MRAGAHGQAGQGRFRWLLLAVVVLFSDVAFAQDAIKITASGNHTCVLRQDGSTACWGDNDYGQGTSPTPNGPFTELAAGTYHNCGLRTDGSVACWGANDYGQSTPPEPNGPFTALAAGYAHTCGLREDGSAACWGSNGNGEGTPPTPNGPFTALVAGEFHTCGLRTDASAACWGWDAYGQSTPPIPNGPWVVLAAGGWHTCALREDGSAACWGDNDDGQSTPPTPNGPFTALSVGMFHTCGLREDGSAVCWGSDSDGQSSPPPNGPFIALAAGTIHTCALRADGSVACWGDNELGQTDVPDVTPPTITAAANRVPNAAGWFRTNAKVTWVCNDTDSGVVACPPPQRFKTETTAEGVTTPAYVISDNAGNQSAPSNQITIRIDKTKPQITATPTTEPNAFGWYTGNVTLHYACTDALSGIATCPADTVITKRGASVAVPKGKAVDVAGNTATTVAFTLNIDSNKPKISAIEFSGPLVVGAEVTATAVADDPQSGIASSECEPVDTSKARKRNLTCTVTNGAGLVATKKATYTVTAE